MLRYRVRADEAMPGEIIQGPCYNVYSSSNYRKIIESSEKLDFPLAPLQQVILQPPKENSLDATIDQDEDYLKFLENENKEEEPVAEPIEKITPLLKYLMEQKALKAEKRKKKKKKTATVPPANNVAAVIAEPVEKQEKEKPQKKDKKPNKVSIKIKKTSKA